MKKIVSIFIILQLSSCNGIFGVSDYEGPAESILYAKKSNLLKEIYLPSKKKIVINSEEYEIIESWTSYRFNNNKSKVINKSSYEFLIVIKNCKTKEMGLSKNIIIKHNYFIKLYFEKFDFFLIDTDKICVKFITKKTPNLPNEFKIGFKSKNEEDIITFRKVI